MALTTLSGVNAASPGRTLQFLKTTTVGGSGSFISSWTAAAGLPGTGATPSSGLAGDVPTDATVGSYPFVNPASGNSYLARITAAVVPSTPSQILLAVYDRLWHNSGLSSTSTLPQVVSVNDAAAVHLTRPDANGASVEAWYEVYVVMGAGTPTVTLAYTDQSGNVETTGTSGVLATTMPVGRTAQFQLAIGDTGVRSIQTWTASATFTSGTIGLVMRRHLTSTFLTKGFPASFDAIALGLPRVYDDACLEILFLANGSGAFSLGATMSLVQG